MIIVLDTFPTSSVAKLPAKVHTLLDTCHQWVRDCELQGHRILIPAISYYETLRELEMRQATSQIVRLQAFCLQPRRFLPLRTEHLELAAQLWGQSRRLGLATADPKALDGDAILAAQVLKLNIPTAEIVIATTNVAHISRYATAELWSNIQP